MPYQNSALSAGQLAMIAIVVLATLAAWLAAVFIAARDPARPSRRLLRRRLRPAVPGNKTRVRMGSRVAAAVSCAVVLGASPLISRPAHTPASRPGPGVLTAAVAGRCPAAPYGARFYAPGGAGRTVALTFDDGPGASTAAILAILARNQIPATFPNLGENMPVRPQLVRREATQGYVLGNHTWNHPIMTRLSASAQAAEMDRVIAEQRFLTRTVPCVFRPPYGIYDATTLHLAQQRRMGVWLWSVDTQDWMARGSGSSYWVRRIIGLAESEGGRLRHPVVLMHNQPVGNPATVSALPSIIRFFRSHGYRFVAL